MSVRPAGRWPVSRTTAYLIGSAVAAGALAAKVPALRGGLFLLAATAVVASWVVVNHRRSRRPSN